MSNEMDNVVKRAKDRCDKGDIDTKYVMLLAKELAKQRKFSARLVKENLLLAKEIIGDKNEALDWFNGRIQDLHELAFTVLEEKKSGADLVPIEEYERLLNWSIEMMQGFRDDVDEHAKDIKEDGKHD